MNRYVAIAGFLAGVGLTMVIAYMLDSMFEEFAWPYIYFNYSGSDAVITPPSYWPVIFTLCLPLAIAVGIHSYRTTLKKYQSKI
jgi:ABC-type lipoprotein release transport system permease subunit